MGTREGGWAVALVADELPMRARGPGRSSEAGWSGCPRGSAVAGAEPRL